MIRQLTSDDYENFVKQKQAVAVHFDAEWDVSYRPITRLRMSEAAEVLAERVNLGEVDCSGEPELAKSIQVLNVPAVAYYLDGNLVGVLVGARQNIQARLERLLRGGQIATVTAWMSDANCCNRHLQSELRITGPQFSASTQRLPGHSDNNGVRCY